MIFASRGSKPRKYPGFALARSQKHRYLRCFLFRECEKSRKHPLFDAFWGFAKTVALTILGSLQKVPTTKITTTTTTGPSSNSYNNNNNNNNDDDDAADDDEDDDNNDNDDNDDSYLVQMKSPSLFPSPNPYRHRRCAKLYNLYSIRLSSVIVFFLFFPVTCPRGYCSSKSLQCGASQHGVGSSRSESSSLADRGSKLILHQKVSSHISVLGLPSQSNLQPFKSRRMHLKFETNRTE